MSLDAPRVIEPVLYQRAACVVDLKGYVIEHHGAARNGAHEIEATFVGENSAALNERNFLTRERARSRK